MFAGNVVLENDIFVRIDTVNAEGGKIKEFLRSKVRSVEYGTMDVPEIKDKGLFEVPEKVQEVLEILPEDKSFEDAAVDEVLVETQTILSKPQETVIYTDEDITSLLRKEEGGEPDLLQVDINKTQIEQMEAQMQTLRQPKNIAMMIGAAMAALLVVSAVPILICGIIGFIVARKFDAAEGDVANISKKPKTGFRMEVDQVGKTPSIEKSVAKVADAPKRGGFFRRVIARNVDLYLGVGSIGVCYSLLGLIIPLDKMSIVLTLGVLLPLMFIFFFYFFLGVSKLDNTYGRYLMGIKVIDAQTNNRLSLLQAFKRDFFIFLWPIDVFALIFSKSKKRIGDNFAGTIVVVIPKVKWFMRLIPGVVLGVFLYSFLYVSSPYVNDHMSISVSAKKYLGEQLGLEILAKPSRVQIHNNEGMVNLKLKSGENYSVQLINSPDGWKVNTVTRIPESFLGKGYSINYTN